MVELLRFMTESFGNALSVIILLCYFLFLVSLLITGIEKFKPITINYINNINQGNEDEK